MSPDALPLPRLKLHGLAGPTGDDARRLLTHAAHVDGRGVEQVWAEVCSAAGLSTGAYLLTVEEAEALAEAMVLQPGAVGVAGRDFRVRVHTYRLLAAEEAGADPAQRPYDAGFASAAQLVRSRMPDDRRLAAIAELALFSEASRTLLDQAARRATEQLGGQIGLVTLLTAGAQSFVGDHGLEGWAAEAGGTPVEWAFCATTVRRREAYVVPDARTDVHQRSNPLTGPIVSYAGVPLITADGHALGALCVLGDAPAEPGPEQLEALAAVAAETVGRLEAARVPRVRTSAA
ncbi:GAF domain-containing protein [Kineococcus sp. R8]|uniref:GAF domain-containing protein n=1 Tax=Kineococcus siccus TaxID=2696567 RepID=UPI00141318A4|nr:GAF domain-containing protein [Kineococcus siccus]NAZ81904.1 GAF domain-containing protein [Kineococcus siccus]